MEKEMHLKRKLTLKEWQKLIRHLLTLDGKHFLEFELKEGGAIHLLFLFFKARPQGIFNEEFKGIGISLLKRLKDN
jgi:hypothetical protein